MSTKIKLQIKNRWTGNIIFEYEKEDNTIKDTLLKAIESRAVLRGADLTRADLTDAVLTDADLRGAVLRGADLTRADLRDAVLTDADLTRAVLRGAVLARAVLRGADLTDADLTDAVLTDADLRGAVLTDADLTRADLTRAVLTPFKNDMFLVLLHSIPEIQFLRQNIVDGKIDGSTYDGDCACLSGTLVNGAVKSNGPQQETVVGNIMKCRDSGRPIERFFLAIKIGDTPENSQFSKLALEWIDEFLALINRP